MQGTGPDPSTVEPGRPPPSPWAIDAQLATAALGVDPQRGLDDAEVLRRRSRFGTNRLRQVRRRSAFGVLVEQFQSLIVVLLVGAAGISLAFGEWLEGIAIAVVIVLNAAIGFATELRAVRSMESLRRLARVDATVRRGGRALRTAAETLVPGDVVLVEAGDVISADLRLLHASKLQANESTLTGESAPVEKSVEPVGPDAALAERPCMLFKGTSLTRGAGEGLVVATGMQTELGRISALVQTAEPEATPLERRLDALGRRLVWVTLVVAALVAVAGLVGGRAPLLVVEISIALAVATVPEGLPIVATIALARGMWRMARRHALIEELPAVETLGSTSVILCDKTGTLTENRMSAVLLELATGPVELDEAAFRGGGAALGEPGVEALRVGVLCNNGALAGEGGDDEAQAVGDPTELALLVAGARAGIDQASLLHQLPEVREVAFDPETRRMATLHRRDDALWVAVKGAAETVLTVCTGVRTASGVEPLDAEQRRAWLARNEALASRGLRVLALASGTRRDASEDPYAELTLLGLIAMLDPPREDVATALRACGQAGIRVVMVTGDHAATAQTVAVAVGLLDADALQPDQVVDARALAPDLGASRAEEERLLGARVIARASPQQKLALIALYQARGDVVAMTGDGVNDAPALRKADIGIAMGRRGTQVAREAAAMVLEDDRFSSIVAAVEQGRAIFVNIRKFVVYLLSCNVSEILVVALAALAQAPLPLLPLQILFLNLVTDVFPALALGVGEGDPSLMTRAPRRAGERVLTRGHWWTIGAYGALITAVVLVAMALAMRWLEMPPAQAITVSFLTLAFAQLWHVFNLRERHSRRLRNEITRNPWLWSALGLCGALLLAAVYVPGLAEVLAVSDPGPRGWALVLGASFVPVLLGQLVASRLPRDPRQAA